MSEGSQVTYSWRGTISDDEMVELVESHGGNPVAGWWEQIRPQSLGWVTARSDGMLVGFVNVAWDGGDHAFLLDTKTQGDHQRRGIATKVVALAAQQARAAGCEWLHVDFRPELAPSTSTLAASGRPTPDSSTCHLPSRAHCRIARHPRQHKLDDRCGLPPRPGRRPPR